MRARSGDRYVVETSPTSMHEGRPYNRKTGERIFIMRGPYRKSQPMPGGGPVGIAVLCFQPIPVVCAAGALRKARKLR
jgi:hypothetical protein